MYNRKFDIKRDFDKLNYFENTIMPIIRKLENYEDQQKVELFMKYTFDNQFKQ